jgi:hypothetical protein
MRLLKESVHSKAPGILKEFLKSTSITEEAIIVSKKLS